MRIKIGIASANLSILSSTSPATGLLIVRTDQDMIFYSTAMVNSSARFIGAVRTDWIQIPSAVNRYFSELRGRNLNAKLMGTCNSSPGGSVVQARLVIGGQEGTAVTQQTRAWGSFERLLEARGSWFIRTTPSVSHLPVTRPCAERLQGVWDNVSGAAGLMGSGVSLLRSLFQ
jgi:hypothetical protein